MGKEMGGVGGCVAENAAPVEAGGFWRLPQMTVGEGSETITPNPARKQKQVT